MSYFSIDHQVHGARDLDRQSATSLLNQTVSYDHLQDQLWHYRSQFKTLLELCLDSLHMLSLSSSFPSEGNPFRQCHHRLRLWSTGSYTQLVNDDTCEWNRGAQALMNLVAVSLIDIAILLGNLSNERETPDICHRARLASVLTHDVPKLVMQYRLQMAWVHESDCDRRESQDVEYLARIVERLYTLLPAMRDLRKVAVLEEERRLHCGQQMYEADGCINSSLPTVSESDEKLNASTLLDTAVSTYLSMGSMFYSLLDCFANLRKQTWYQAEELKSLHIALSAIPTAKISTSSLTQHAQTRTKMQAGQPRIDREASKHPQCMKAVSQHSSLSVDVSAEVLSQGKLHRCEQKLREDRAHRQTALGAGAAGLLIARMLLTRRARLRVRV